MGGRWVRRVATARLRARSTATLGPGSPGGGYTLASAAGGLRAFQRPQGDEPLDKLPRNPGLPAS